MTRRIAALALALLLALSGMCLADGDEPEPAPAAEPEIVTPAADAPAEPEVNEEPGGGDGEELPGDAGNSGGSEDDNPGEGSGDSGDTDPNPGGTGEGDTGEGGDNPDGNDDNPGGGDDNPDGNDDNPGGGDDNPDEGGDNPGEGGDNPGEGDDNPGGGDDNPGEGDDNPGEGDDNPGEGDPAPGVLTIEVATAGVAQAEGGAWQIPYASPEDAICFRWTAIEGAWYEWTVADEAGSCISSGSQAECALSLRAQDCAGGSFTLTVTATIGEESLCASLRFALAQAQPPQEEQPERPSFGGRPSGGFGGRPSGGFGGGQPSGGAAEGAAPEEEQGFRVTPGTALTDSHAAGTKDMTPYGAANLSLPEEPVATLALSGTEADVRRADGGSFTAALEEEALTLACDDDAAQWCVNPLALKALHQSGVTILRLNFGEHSVALPTDLELTGAVYASYRARGYVSKDFELRVSPDGIAATVDGETYALSDAYELIEM